MTWKRPSSATVLPVAAMAFLCHGLSFVLGVFPFGGDDEDCVIVVYFCTTSWAVFIFRAVREAAFSLAFRAKIRATAFAVENLAEIFPAAARAAVIILSHWESAPFRYAIILP